MAGRPQRTFASEQKKLPKNWKSLIFDLANKGGFDIEYKALFNGWCGYISNDIWSRWLSEDGEFQETIKHARELSACWFAERGRKGIGEGKEFNATAFLFMACNAHSSVFKRNADNFSEKGTEETGKTQVMNFGKDKVVIND